MKVFDGIDTLPKPFATSTVAIGTFDGIHIGHQEIIRTAVRDARSHGRTALVFTFDRHPADLLAPDRAPLYITTPSQRSRLIAGLGADGLVIARFDAALAQLSPDAFVEMIVKLQLGAKAIVVGSNFCFGKGRAGDVHYLTAAQARFDFTLHTLNPISVGNEPASSTRVREYLRSGDIAAAETVLGHPFWLEGTVVAGRRLGRTLGYPTANLNLSCRQVVPADGIYAVTATLGDGRTVGGACSIGNRPTVDGAGHAIETYLLDFDEDIYGRTMELRFIELLRPEEKFDSLEALQVQMGRDVERARQVVSLSVE